MAMLQFSKSNNLEENKTAYSEGRLRKCKYQSEQVEIKIKQKAKKRESIKNLRI